MGIGNNVGLSNFPKQGSWLSKRTKVIFHYNTNDFIMGTVVRDDVDSPFVTIIKLDDGRYILAEECQHQPVN